MKIEIIFQKFNIIIWGLNWEISMQNTALIHEQTFENTSLNVQPVLTKTKVLIKIEKNDIRTCRVKNDYLAGALLLCIKTPTGHNM